MFDKLKQKWGVNSLNLGLILLTFAVGGSLCGRLGRLILNHFEAKGVVFYVLYIILVTILWPISVLTVSLLTGQFKFFKVYIQKILKRFF